MSIHALLEQSRRNLVWCTCPADTTSAMSPAAPAVATALAGQLSASLQPASGRFTILLHRGAVDLSGPVPYT